MRLPAALAGVLLFLLPLAAAEDAGIRAVGMTLGQARGVAGLQWDDDSAVGARYWFNGTSGDQMALVLTTCVVMDSGSGLLYCERHHLTA